MFWTGRISDGGNSGVMKSIRMNTRPKDKITVFIPERLIIPVTAMVSAEGLWVEKLILLCLGINPDRSFGTSKSRNDLSQVEIATYYYFCCRKL
jgi:hypothetical protein